MGVYINLLTGNEYRVDCCKNRASIVNVRIFDNPKSAYGSGYMKYGRGDIFHTTTELFRRYIATESNGGYPIITVDGLNAIESLPEEQWSLPSSDLKDTFNSSIPFLAAIVGKLISRQMSINTPFSEPELDEATRTTAVLWSIKLSDIMPGAHQRLFKIFYYELANPAKKPEETYVKLARYINEVSSNEKFKEFWTPKHLATVTQALMDAYMAHILHPVNAESKQNFEDGLPQIEAELTAALADNVSLQELLLVSDAHKAESTARLADGCYRLSKVKRTVEAA